MPRKRLRDPLNGGDCAAGLAPRDDSSPSCEMRGRAAGRGRGDNAWTIQESGNRRSFLRIIKSALAWRPGATTGRALTRSGRPGPGVSLDPLRGGASGGSGRGSPGTPARPPRSGLRLCGPTAGGSAARAARAKMAAGVQPAPGGEAGAVPQEPARLARAPSGEVAPAWPAYGDP